jgi:hypothetical protein
VSLDQSVRPVGLLHAGWNRHGGRRRSVRGFLPIIYGAGMIQLVTLSTVCVITRGLRAWTMGGMGARRQRT